MRTFKNNDELKALIVDGSINIDDDIHCPFDIDVNASIKANDIDAHDITALNIEAHDINAYKIDAHNIDAYNIDAHDINAHNIDAYNIDAYKIDAHNIDAHNIDAYNIDAHDIDAHDINAHNITAHDIDAHNIDAHDINAHNIDAHDINYHAFCISYKTLKCKSIKSLRKNSVHVCLDSDIEMKNPTRTITIDGKSIEISEESFQAFKDQFFNNQTKQNENI